MQFTDFILVRHGETDYNKNHVIQGWVDTPLNEIGRKQAETAAEVLKNESFDEVWYSDLQRAANTAEAILKYHPEVPSFSSPELREWHLGFMQDMSYAELQEKNPEYKKMLRTESMNLPVQDGESRSQFQLRVHSFLQKLADRSSGKRILIVSHGGVLVRLFRLAGGVIPPEGSIPVPGNASVSRIRYDHERKNWSLLIWDETFSPKIKTSSSAPSL